MSILYSDLLTTQQSTHILDVPSFLGTSRAGRRCSPLHILLLGSKPLGITFGNTSSKSCKRVTIALGKDDFNSLIRK